MHTLATCVSAGTRHRPFTHLGSVPLPYCFSLLEQKGLLGEMSSLSLNSNSSIPRMRGRGRGRDEMVSKIQRALRSGCCFRPMTECTRGFCGSGTLGQKPCVMGWWSQLQDACLPPWEPGCAVRTSAQFGPVLLPAPCPAARLPTQAQWLSLWISHVVVWLSSMSSSWCLRMVACPLCLSEDLEEGQSLKVLWKAGTPPPSDRLQD